MNRIETKIIITVTNRLAAAKDSAAKTEMIEELSENLYQRYLELAEEGMPEEEAFQKAMESLGDTEELLAFLREEAGEEAETSREETFHDRDASHTEKTSSFSFDDLENGIEEIVNAAFSTAKVAADCARDVAKDVSEQIRERYPQGVFTKFTGQRGRRVDHTAIPKEVVHSLEIRLTNGNINLICTDEENEFIEVTGDTDEIETMLKDDSILSITQGNTASATYFFMRGMRRSDIEIRLPKKVWEQVNISTVDGDIRVNEQLECRELNLSTVSGHLELERTSSEHMVLRTCSGNIHGNELKGDLHGETKSGNIELCGTYERCSLFSASGDVCFEGESREMSGSSTSGTVSLYLRRLPEKLKGNCISGRCIIRLPAEEGFHMTYRTVSGKFMTNMPLSGKLGEKTGDAVFGDNICGEIQLSNVSGDIEICAAE